VDAGRGRGRGGVGGVGEGCGCLGGGDNSHRLRRKRRWILLAGRWGAGELGEEAGSNLTMMGGFCEDGMPH
jgi:hypothetical protein